MSAVIGREAELASLRDFVTGVYEGASAFVLEGEAGVGKTTIWRAGVAAAQESGLRMLQALPAESETALSFSGIGDLLDPVLDDALAPLPAGQRRALSRALVLGEDEGPTPDPHAVGVALLTALRALAEQQPLVVAIDDVQWLDPASASALAYAGRRLRAERVGVLASRRAGLESTLLDELRRSLPAERFIAADVGPLEAGALHRVLQDHLGVVLPRPLLAEVHEASGGNPFYALEIVRMLRRTGVSVEAGQPLPVPESLHELVHGRLLALPSESRDFLLAAAAYAHPTISVTEEACGVGRGVGLEPALEARIVDLEGQRLRFTHPLFAAGVYEAADPLRRLEIHTRLAELLEDPEARAWQLAASIDQPNEVVATVLEDAASYARARGAPRPAALLLDRAQELTPVDRPEDARRRAVDAAFLHFESGDSPRAEAQLRELIAPLAPGRERAKALNVLARIRTYDAPGEATELFLQVVAEAEGDQETLALAHEGVASCLIWQYVRLDQVVQHAEVAFGVALDLGDEALAADVLLSKVSAEALLGRTTAGATADKALALQESAMDRRLLDQPLIALAEYWTWIDAPDRARDTLGDLLQRATELGDENSRPWLLVLRGEAECALGNLADALDYGREAATAAEQSGQPLFAALSLALQSLVLAQLGRPEETTVAARQALGLVPGGTRKVGLAASFALGHLELARGASEQAAVCLEPIVEFVRSEAIIEPGAIRFVIDYVEALIELGRRAEAVELLDWYEGNARKLERASALATSMRCRGLLAASEGKLEDAVQAYEEALEWHAKIELPLDRGRTLLALGATQRRAKRRREARETLGAALGVFERIGAELWAERTRTELGRISGRAAAPGALTPAEERVAALVAEGKTNREVGAALFLSERTVEGHLSHVFGKLGVRSRTELARALASGSIQEVAASNPGDSPVSGTPSAL